MAMPTWWCRIPGAESKARGLGGWQGLTPLPAGPRTDCWGLWRVDCWTHVSNSASVPPAGAEPLPRPQPDHPTVGRAEGRLWRQGSRAGHRGRVQGPRHRLTGHVCRTCRLTLNRVTHGHSLLCGWSLVASHPERQATALNAAPPPRPRSPGRDQDTDLPTALPFPGVQV